MKTGIFKHMKKGKCKQCGKPYGYIGLDLGLCVPCIDKLEDATKSGSTEK